MKINVTRSIYGTIYTKITANLDREIQVRFRAVFTLVYIDLRLV